MIALMVVSGGFLSWPGGRMRAALGKGGLTTSKREGDGATPVGMFPLRDLWYRADRLPAPPKTDLGLRIIGQDEGWSDDPRDPLYNRAVRLPHPFGHETMWREDGVYDLVVPLGYNDDPVVPGLGSAIFFHCATPDYAPTHGCIAIARDDLLTILAGCGPETWLDIRPV
jgi:L,D-peptidoglycan transpeptidase YkuD (ErfK/YbiS/YcfS/YnhG family)